MSDDDDQKISGEQARAKLLAAADRSWLDLFDTPEYTARVERAAIREAVNEIAWTMLDEKRGLPFNNEQDIAIVVAWLEEYADEKWGEK